MRPKDERGGDWEMGRWGGSAEAAADGPGPDIDLTDEERLVLKLLREQSPGDLNELKGKTGLSNKKWDTAIKGLRAKELVTVEKTDDPPSLTIHLL